MRTMTVVTTAVSLALVSAAAIAAATAGGPAAAVSLEPLWTTTGLANPESVARSADGAFLYVSNVAGDGAAKDGNGFVSMLDSDGRIAEREWVGGLDGPKGIALRGDRMFVSDITSLAEIDVAKRTIVARHPAPGAAFLNDVAFAPDGAVLVSDSATSRIYAYTDSDASMSVWLEDPQLHSINGLLREDDRLVVTTMQGKLLAVDWQSRAITTLAVDLGNADGVVRLDDGAYLVGEWPGRLFLVGADGSSVVLLDTRDTGQYHNDFIRDRDRLLVPHLEPGSLSAYRIVD